MKADIQQGEVSSSSIDNNILFDEYGRCLPGKLEAIAHAKSRRYFLLEQPEIDYQKIYTRLDNCFDFASSISVEAFEQRANAILNEIRNDNRLSSMLNGVYVPFILPKADYNDIGLAMEQHYLTAVNNSFNERFPDYEFLNHYSDSLDGKLTVASGSRHQTLIDAMKHDVVVGIYFPCLLEYSVPAAREKIADLPDSCLLAGGYDTAAAFIAAPELLQREDGYPPLLWLSGLNTNSEHAGFHFEAYGYDLTFNRRVHNQNSAEYWASGLVIIG